MPGQRRRAARMERRLGGELAGVRRQDRQAKPLKEGIPASAPDREHGGQETERLRVVDWQHPENNDFLRVSR